jgi:secreted trypsin-like serine protease
MAGRTMRRTFLSAIAIVGSLLSAHCGSEGSEETTSDQDLIGGTVAKPGQYPASIQINRGPDSSGTPFTKCTGIPISRHHILLAAHCLFKVVHGVQQTFGLTMFYSYGVNAEKLVVADIKATYLPEEAKRYLETHGTWATDVIAEAHDVAVVEVEQPVPAAIALGTMSSKEVAVGTRFRYGGYGCEQHASTPADPAVTAGATGKARLKYAQGTVTEVSPLVAQGPTYEGLAKQSLCPGDSGGPVYLDASPQDPDRVLTEFIGINNFHKTSASGDDVNSEINFSVITKQSKLGRWVDAVLAGTVTAFEDE